MQHLAQSRKPFMLVPPHYRGVASLTVPDGEESNFPHFSSNFHPCLLYFLKLSHCSHFGPLNGWVAPPLKPWFHHWPPCVSSISSKFCNLPTAYILGTNTANFNGIHVVKGSFANDRTIKQSIRQIKIEYDIALPLIKISALLPSVYVKSYEFNYLHPL